MKKLHAAVITLILATGVLSSCSALSNPALSPAANPTETSPLPPSPSAATQPTALKPPTPSSAPQTTPSTSQPSSSQSHHSHSTHHATSSSHHPSHHRTHQTDPSQTNASPNHSTNDAEMKAGNDTALHTLGTLEVKKKAPYKPFTRDDFGQAWLDISHTGCDTRDRILARDLKDTAINRDCKVRSGTLTDPYSGQTIHFQRGKTTSDSVEIDHVVPIADAWHKGAQEMAVESRLKFANDPLNLLAVSAQANQDKGDLDASRWLPSNTGFRCEYVARQISVKAAYKIWVTEAEKNAFEKQLSFCPTQKAYESTIANSPLDPTLVAEQEKFVASATPDSPYEYKKH